MGVIAAKRFYTYHAVGFMGRGGYLISWGLLLL
jgi:hypothetical protein